MSNIILRHSNGSKAGLLESFSLEPGASIKIGLGRGHEVKFDGEMEAMVSRSHCRIIRSKGFGSQYYIEDIASVHGTYVNNSKIAKPILLNTGDVITIGKNGPKITFAIDTGLL